MELTSIKPINIYGTNDEVNVAPGIYGRQIVEPDSPSNISVIRYRITEPDGGWQPHEHITAHQIQCIEGDRRRWRFNRIL